MLQLINFERTLRLYSNCRGSGSSSSSSSSRTNSISTTKRNNRPTLMWVTSTRVEEHDDYLFIQIGLQQWYEHHYEVKYITEENG